MATASFFPVIDPTIPHGVQRHLQLIYGKLNDHAQAFALLPKSSGPQPITVKTFYPSIESTIPHAVQRHLQLIYNKINNHGIAFTQLPKVDIGKANQTASKVQTSAPAIESGIPHDIERHLQLIYSRLDNHARAFEVYNAAMPKQ